MSNKIECAGQDTVDLINNNVSRNVQEACANKLYRVYIAAVRMENNEYLTVHLLSNMVGNQFKQNVDDVNCDKMIDRAV